MLRMHVVLLVMMIPMIVIPVMVMVLLLSIVMVVHLAIVLIESTMTTVTEAFLRATSASFMTVSSSVRVPSSFDVLITFTESVVVSIVFPFWKNLDSLLLVCTDYLHFSNIITDLAAFETAVAILFTLVLQLLPAYTHRWKFFNRGHPSLGR